MQLNPGARDYISPGDSHGALLVSPPRKVPAAFRLAKVLPFRWWYVWTLFMVAIAPIALWHAYPVAFVAVVVITLVTICGFQLQAAATRFTLLKWGQAATVTGTEMLSRGSYYSGTTWSNVYLPVAHGWRVTRQRWSGPSTKTRIRYRLNGYQGELVVADVNTSKAWSWLISATPREHDASPRSPMTSTATSPAIGSADCARD